MGRLRSKRSKRQVDGIASETDDAGNTRLHVALGVYLDDINKALKKIFRRRPEAYQVLSGDEMRYLYLQTQVQHRAVRDCPFQGLFKTPNYEGHFPCDTVLNWCCQYGGDPMAVSREIKSRIMKALFGDMLFNMLPKRLLDAPLDELREHSRFGQLLSRGYYDLVEKFLALKPSLGTVGFMLKTPAMVAASDCQDIPDHIMKKLVNPKVVNLQQEYTGETAAHMAASSGNWAVLQHLIAANCRLDITDNDGSLPMHKYLDHGGTIDPDIVKHLLPHNMSFNLFLGTVIPWLLSVKLDSEWMLNFMKSIMFDKILFPKFEDISLRYSSQCCSRPNEGCISLSLKDVAESHTQEIANHFNFCQAKVLSSIIKICEIPTLKVPSYICPKKHQDDSRAHHISAINRVWKESNTSMVPTLRSGCIDTIRSHVLPLTRESLHKLPLPRILIQSICRDDVANRICYQVEAYEEHKTKCSQLKARF